MLGVGAPNPERRGKEPEKGAQQRGGFLWGRSSHPTHGTRGPAAPCCPKHQNLPQKHRQRRILEAAASRRLVILPARSTWAPCVHTHTHTDTHRHTHLGYAAPGKGPSSQGKVLACIQPGSLLRAATPQRAFPPWGRTGRARLWRGGERGRARAVGATPGGCGMELEGAAGRGGRGGSPAPWMGAALGSPGTAPPVPAPPPAPMLGVLGAKRGGGSSPVYVRVPWAAPFVPKKLHGLTPEGGLLARHGAGPPRSTGRAQAGERQVGASHEALHRPVQGDTAGTRPPRGPAPGAQALVTASPGSKPSGEPGQPVLGATWR